MLKTKKNSNGVVDCAVCLPVVKGKLSVAAWRREADPWNIEHTIAAPTGAMVVIDNAESNIQMVKLTRNPRNRISGLAVVNPWHGKRGVDMLRKAFDQGLAGLYLYPSRQGFRLTDKIVDPLIKVCRTHNRPVYSHTGTPGCEMPFQLAELARRFPSVTFVMGHAAWSDFSGYDVIPAARQAPNIMIETSCTVACLVRTAISELGADRLLFGTGYPHSLPGHEFAKIEDLGLSKDDMKLLMRDNAIRLWKLPL